jgi:hypothetical protein
VSVTATFSKTMRSILEGRTPLKNADCPLECFDSSLHIVVTELERKEPRITLQQPIDMYRGRTCSSPFMVVGLSSLGERRQPRVCSNDLQNRFLISFKHKTYGPRLDTQSFQLPRLHPSATRK